MKRLLSQYIKTIWILPENMRGRQKECQAELTCTKAPHQQEHDMVHEAKVNQSEHRKQGH